MKAVVFDEYGPPEVLRVEEVEKPTPGEDQVLVQVHATTVNRSDCGVRGADPFFVRFFTGLRRPKNRTPGMEFAGVVTAIGSAVTDLAVGDEVFGVKGAGANAEFTLVRAAGSIARKPASMSFEEAAAVCDGACIARACLAKAGDLFGRHILIYGASGSIGTAAVQLAKHQGARVTAVCNGRNAELVRSLGADEVLDYEREDFTRNGVTYDAVFDAVGKQSFRRCRGSIVDGGVFITTDLGWGWHVPPLALLTRWIGSKKVTLPVPKYSRDDVQFLKELIDAGEYRAVIDRTYPLEDVVEATRYVETGQKTGNVVLTLNGAGR
jgi:NADPH:quinone reductase-like Zn-dependent oxidoreductase